MGGRRSVENAPGDSRLKRIKESGDDAESEIPSS